MNYNTPTLALIAKLTQALGELSRECQSNHYFADELGSEEVALSKANRAHAEASAFLKSAKDANGTEVVLNTQLADWNQENARAPHHVRVAVTDVGIDLAIWPVERGDEPAGGLSVMVEVNQGLAAMHLSQASGEECCMHVHGHPDGTIEFARDSDRDGWKTEASRVYPSAQAEHWKP